MYNGQPNSFTNLDDTDYRILFELDDQSLYYLCHTNKYVQSLCFNNLILSKRIKDYSHFLRVAKIIDKARDYDDKVFIHIIFNYNPVNKLTKKDIINLIPDATNVNIYSNDIGYIIGGDNMYIYQSIKIIVEALGYSFYPLNIHPRQGLVGEIEYDL